MSAAVVSAVSSNAACTAGVLAAACIICVINELCARLTATLGQTGWPKSLSFSSVFTPLAELAESALLQRHCGRPTGPATAAAPQKASRSHQVLPERVVSRGVRAARTKKHSTMSTLLTSKPKVKSRFDSRDDALEGYLAKRSERSADSNRPQNADDYNYDDIV